jgi:hypothetical protein
MADIIQTRRDTAANWTSVNPILAVGEAGYETDTNKLKYGNGSDAWTALAYFEGGTNTRVQSTASTATLTPDVDSYDMAVITAQAAALLIANPTGTPSNRNAFVIDIEDNGTARAITWDTDYTGLFKALPSTTILGKRIVMPLMYNSTSGLWELLNVINEI